VARFYVIPLNKFTLACTQRGAVFGSRYHRNSLLSAYLSCFVAYDELHCTVAYVLHSISLMRSTFRGGKRMSSHQCKRMLQRLNGYNMFTVAQRRHGNTTVLRLGWVGQVVSGLARLQYCGYFTAFPHSCAHQIRDECGRSLLLYKWLSWSAQWHSADCINFMWVCFHFLTSSVVRWHAVLFWSLSSPLCNITSSTDAEIFFVRSACAFCGVSRDQLFLVHF